MSKQLILFLLFAMMHYMTVAQNYRVAGTVSDKTNRERLEGVNVLLYVGKEKKLLKFTTTTTEGSFRMMIPDSLTGKGYLQFSFMGYETLRKNIDHEKRWDIYLSQKEMTIKEIIVKAPKVRYKEIQSLMMSVYFPKKETAPLVMCLEECPVSKRMRTDR